MRYRPVPSVMTVRVFSMSAGLSASTVTPGSTAPELSFTVPVIEACAYAVMGRIRMRTDHESRRAMPRISTPL